MYIKKVIKRIIKYGIRFITDIKIVKQGVWGILIAISRGKRFKKNDNHDSKVILLGNGPSLNKVDVNKLAEKYDIACVNWFALKESLFFVAKPKYYFLVDPAFFVESSKEYKGIEQQIKKMRIVLERVTWEMTLIVPQKMSFKITNPKIHYDYISSYKLCADGLEDFVYWLYDKNFANCGMQNVLCGALHYFIVNRFEEIYLAGVDFDEFQSFSIDENNHVIAVFKHFYDESKYDLTENGDIELGCFYRWIGYYAEMLKEIHYLGEYANSRDVKIFNTTKNSYIDTFEKTELKY